MSKKVNGYLLLINNTDLAYTFIINLEKCLLNLKLLRCENFLKKLFENFCPTNLIRTPFTQSFITKLNHKKFCYREGGEE